MDSEGQEGIDEMLSKLVSANFTWNGEAPI